MLKLLYAAGAVLDIYLFIHCLFRCKIDKFHLFILGLAAALGVYGVNLFGNPWLIFSLFH